MKKIYLLFIVIGFTVQIKAITNYEDKLKTIAFELAGLIERRGIEKIAIWNFQPLDNSQQIISQHFSEDLSVYLTNSSSSLQVFDRQFLDQIIEELRLQQSGLIDQNTAKRIGAFTGVEAIVTGQFALTGTKLKVWIKVLETESAYQIAALKNELPWKNRVHARNIHEKRKTIKERRSKPSRNDKRIGTGSLYLSNRKSVSISVKIKNEEFEKTILVGSNSKSTVYDLKPGIYTCVATIPIHNETLETFEIKIIKNRIGRKKFKGFNPFRYY